MSTKKYLDKDGLIFLWAKIKDMFATKEQGTKAESALQTIKIGTDGENLNKDGTAVLPTYPTVPTNVGDFTNNVKYQTENDVKNAITEAVGAITQVEFIKLASGEYDAETGVPTISSQAKSGKIYLTKNSGSTPNQYDEYIWLASDSAFEKIGTTDVDLSGYVLSSDLVAITNAEIETIINPPEVSA